MNEHMPEWARRLRILRQQRFPDPRQFVDRLYELAPAGFALPARESMMRNLRLWEAGTTRRPQGRYRSLIARALSIPVEDLFETYQEQPAPGRDGSGISLETMWAAGGQGHPAPPQTGTGHSSPPPRARRRTELLDVEIFRNVLAALTISDRHFSDQHARAYATDYLFNVIEPRLHAPASDHVRQELFGVVTEFTLRAAAMHLDAGSTSTSTRLLGRARRAAQRSEDVTLKAWVSARQGEQEIHQAQLAHLHRHRGHGATRIRRAVDYSGRGAALAVDAPPLAKAFLLAKHALALSMTGDKPATIRVVSQLRRCQDKIGTGREPQWIGIYDQANIQHELARVYCNLRLGDQALQAVEASLHARRSGRPLAFSLAAKASAHLTASDVDIAQACDVALQLIALAGQMTSARLLLRIGELLRELEAHASFPAVRDVWEAARPLLAALPTT
ncbi:hypothetical protein ACWEJ6_49825 [Nonomuraea sp. NPDC004702]